MLKDVFPIDAKSSLSTRTNYAHIWSLGIDIPAVYRCKFSINAGQLVEIEGWQSNLGLADIRYSIVKRDGLQPIYVESVHVSEGCFRFHYADIPPGEKYEIEVYNFGCGLCFGAFNMAVLS